MALRAIQVDESRASRPSRDRQGAVPGATFNGAGHHDSAERIRGFKRKIAPSALGEPGVFV